MKTHFCLLFMAGLTASAAAQVMTLDPVDRGWYDENNYPQSR